MRFNVGPYAYHVEITSDELEGDDGSRLLGLCEFLGRRIWISSRVPRGERLDVVLHELRHAWANHVPAPRTEEEEANLWALATASTLRDLEAQGGTAALEALEPDAEARPEEDGPSGPRALTFNIGPHTYHVEISADELRLEDGTRAVGLCESETRRIRISFRVPRGDRLQVLLHELYHAWVNHVPEPRDEEEAADLYATVCTSAMRDLDEQGGAAALEALEPADSSELTASPALVLVKG